MGEFKITKVIHKSNASELSELKTQLTNAGITDDDENSVFTSKSGDLDGDGIFTINEQFTYAKNKIGKVEKASYNSKTHERKQAGIKVHLDGVWATNQAEGAKMKAGTSAYKAINDVEKYPTADAVLNKILEINGLNAADFSKYSDLKSDFIKYNISMFKSDETVLLDVDWSRLDFPSIEEIKSNYGYKAGSSPTTPTTPTTPTKSTKPTTPTTPTEDKYRKITTAEKTEANNNGEQVADDLIGYTTDKEIVRINDIINNSVNVNNIVEFLDGYNNNKTGGDSIAKQIATENQSAAWKDGTSYASAKKAQIGLICKIYNHLVTRAIDCKAISKSNTSDKRQFIDWGTNLATNLNTDRYEEFAEQTDSKIDTLMQKIKSKEGNSHVKG